MPSGTWRNLQLDKGDPFEHSNIPLAGIGGAQDGFRKPIDVGSTDRVRQGVDRFLERSRYYLDDIRGKRRIRKVLHCPAGRKWREILLKKNPARPVLRQLVERRGVPQIGREAVELHEAPPKFPAGLLS